MSAAARSLPYISSNSEVKSYTKLDRARVIRVIASRTDLAEVRCIQEVQVRRWREVRVVHHIVDFSTDVHPDSLRNLEAPSEGRVEPAKARTENLGGSASQRGKVALPCRCGYRGIIESRRIPELIDIVRSGVGISPCTNIASQPAPEAVVMVQGMVIG